MAAEVAERSQALVVPRIAEAVTLVLAHKSPRQDKKAAAVAPVSQALLALAPALVQARALQARPVPLAQTITAAADLK